MNALWKIRLLSYSPSVLLTSLCLLHMFATKLNFRKNKEFCSMVNCIMSTVAACICLLLVLDSDGSLDCFHFCSSPRTPSIYKVGPFFSLMGLDFHPTSALEKLPTSRTNEWRTCTFDKFAMAGNSATGLSSSTDILQWLNLECSVQQLFLLPEVINQESFFNSNHDANQNRTSLPLFTQLVQLQLLDVVLMGSKRELRSLPSLSLLPLSGRKNGD